MRLRDLIIMLVVSGMFISGTGLFIADANAYYGIDTESLETFNKLEEAQSVSDDMEKTLELDQPMSTWELIASGLFQTVFMIGGSVHIFSGMLGDIINTFGLPEWVFTGFITLLVVFVIFELAQIFARGKT